MYDRKDNCLREDDVRGLSDIVGICDLQKMLGIGRKAALELAKHPQIHGVIVGNRFRIPKINVIRYMLCDADAS